MTEGERYMKQRERVISAMNMNNDVVQREGKKSPLAGWLACFSTFSTLAPLARGQRLFTEWPPSLTKSKSKVVQSPSATAIVHLHNTAAKELIMLEAHARSRHISNWLICIHATLHVLEPTNGRKI